MDKHFIAYCSDVRTRVMDDVVAAVISCGCRPHYYRHELRTPIIHLYKRPKIQELHLHPAEHPPQTPKSTRQPSPAPPKNPSSVFQASLNTRVLQLTTGIAAAQDACSTSQQSLSTEREGTADRDRVLRERVAELESSAERAAEALAAAVARQKQLEEEKDEALAGCEKVTAEAAAAATAAAEAEEAAAVRQRELEDERENAVARVEGEMRKAISEAEDATELLRQKKVRLGGGG